MENFELIEKYAAGQLQGHEKEAFELQLQTDTSLQNDVALQKQIIEGIKKARITELKTMLSQVPVTGVMLSGGVSATKIIAGAVAVGAIVTGTLFYFKPWQKEVIPSPPKDELSSIQKNESKEVAPVDPKDDKASAPSELNKEAKKKLAPSKKHNAIKPKIEVVDPTTELTKEPSREQEKLTSHKSVMVTSRIGVEINSSSTKYSFHYQFNQGRLILYGIFDSGLYEILEVNGDTHSVFLYYKESYYLLNEKQSAITPLTAIKDPELIKKLKEYRGR